MIKKLFTFIFLCLLIPLPGKLMAQISVTFDQYHDNQEVQQIVETLHKNNSNTTALHTISESPGGQPVTILEIGSHLSDVPAVFVGANFEGNIPLATEGALKFAKMLLDSSAYTSEMKWFILPQPNPDASEGFFSEITYARDVNSFEINDDVDDSVNEDCFNDLNGD